MESKHFEFGFEIECCERLAWVLLNRLITLKTIQVFISIQVLKKCFSIVFEKQFDVERKEMI